MKHLSQCLPERYTRVINSNTYGVRSLRYPADLSLLHRWMNTEHVIQQWQMNKPLHEIATFLEKMLADDHQRLYLILLGETPVGYLEIYECHRDRLARYYQSSTDDMGWHLLFGETWFEGHGHLRPVLAMINHFIFDSLPKTERILFEPDSGVAAFKRVSPDLAYEEIGRLAFPEKDATLYACERKDFFTLMETTIS
ncbi:MAG TPA: GNAT family N-acetyltransferase [Cellvibrio sp.]|nr:GNAT family N-acetyltransferase [Cellvibrio sp.]